MPKKGDNLDLLTAQTAVEHHGKPAIYTVPGGLPIDSLAIVDHNVDQGSLETYATEKVTTIDLLISDVGEPARKASIAIGSDTYLVERKITDDGYLVTVAVRKV